MATEMKYQVKLNDLITLTLSEKDTIVVSKSCVLETYTVSNGQCLLRKESPDVNENFYQLNNGQWELGDVDEKYYRLIRGKWELTDVIRHKTAFQSLDLASNPDITMITIEE